MSYEVLARKWRPQNFEELVGQEQTATALINSLTSGRLHHAYLFTGTRGVGKTTIARIFSKSINCEQGVSANPCGECPTCIAIEQGSFVDLLEIDAASRTKVEDTRELLDNVQYRPTRGRYKVYLIDEVHMLSGHSFNALLKTLEEPPPHVIFLLATTDPQKLPVTVLSRCLQFSLRRMEEEEILNHLAKVLDAESIPWQSDALSLIARSADGSMRDALSLLDQAIVYSGEKLDVKVIEQMLGAVDDGCLYDLLSAVAENDAQKALQIIDKTANWSPDYSALIDSWLRLLHQIAIHQATGQSKEERVSVLADKLSPEDIQLFYQLSLHARRDLAWCPQPRQGLEMLVLRCISFRPLKVASAAASPGAVANNSLGTKVAPQVSSAATTESESVKKKLNNSALVSCEGQTAASSIDTQNVVTGVADGHAQSKFNHAPANRSQGNHPSEEQAGRTQNSFPTNPTNPTESQGRSLEQRLLAAAENSTESKAQDSVHTPSGVKQDDSQTQETIDSFSHGLEEATAGQESIEPAPPIHEVNFDNWYRVVNALKVKGQAQQILLTSLAKFEREKLIITIDPKLAVLLSDNVQTVISQTIRQHYEGETFQIEITPGTLAQETPKQRAARMWEEKLDEIEQSLLEDPQIQILVNELGCVLDRSSIKILTQDKTELAEKTQ